MTTLKSRIEKLESRTRPGTVLIALAERGETAEQAIARTARAWKRPAESFLVKIALNFGGSHA